MRTFALCRVLPALAAIAVALPHAEAQRTTAHVMIGPLVYLRTPETYTVAIGLAQFRGAMTTRWDLQMAAAAIMVIPVIVLFFFAQRYFIKGIVMTGLKG